jgi:WD40 repeat protein
LEFHRVNLTKHWAATLDDYVIDLAWSPDGALLAAASASGPIAIFANADGARRGDLPGHDGGTNCLAWNPAAAATLATGGQDGAVKIWDAAAGQHVTSANLGSAWVEHLGWRPVNAVAGETQSRAPLLFAAAGKTLTALNPDGSTAHAFKPAPKTISALAWQPAGGCVAVSYFGGVCLWDADDFVVQKEFAYANGIQALVWSPDNRWLVSGNQDPSVHLWIPAEDIELQMSGYEGKVKDLSFDHSSRWLATGGGKDCCVWDCSGAGPEGREPLMLPHDAKICAVAFQKNRGLLATASQDGVVQLWSPDRKQPLRATVKMPAAATKLAWSPDDTLLAIGSEKGVVYVLKSEKG